MPTQSKHPGALAYWQKDDLWVCSYVMPGMEPSAGFMIAAIRRHVIEQDGRCRSEFNKLCKRALRLFLQHATPAAAHMMGAAHGG